MAATLRAVGTTLLSSVAGTSHGPVSLPAGFQGGDLHLMFATNSGNAVTFTAPTGWTQIYDYAVTVGGTPGDSRLSVWSRIAEATDAAPTLTSSASTTAVAVIYGFSAGYGGPFNSFVVQNQAESVTWNAGAQTGGSVTPPANGMTVIVAGCIDARNATGASTLDPAATSSDGITVANKAQGQDTTNRVILSVGTYDQVTAAASTVSWTHSDTAGAQPAIMAAFAVTAVNPGGVNRLPVIPNPRVGAMALRQRIKRVARSVMAFTTGTIQSVAPDGINGVATISATVVRTRALTATINGAATITGAVVRIRALTSTINGVATISATVVRTRALTATMNGVTTISGTVVRTRTLSATINGAATITGAVVRTRALSATSTGTTTISLSALTRTRVLSGTINGSSLIGAALDVSSATTVTTGPDGTPVFIVIHL